MHILQLVPSLEVGGVERGVLDLAKGLIARGHRVSVVSSGGPLVERLTQLGAAHHQLPVHDKSLTRIGSCIPEVARLITTTNVDIVHARSRVPGWIGFAAARRTQRPFVTTAHGFYRPHLASRVMVWGRYVIAPSEALGRYLIEQFGLPKERLRVIPRGVDLDEFPFRPSAAPHHGSWRIGLFGRLSRIKGHDVALEACAQLLRRGHDVTLCIAGDPSTPPPPASSLGMSPDGSKHVGLHTPTSPLRSELDSLIKRLQLKDAVEWWGLQHDVATLLASVDLVVVPSRYPESFGRVVIEAQAVGRPVIASRMGALAELIEDGQTGLLVPPNDPRALADTCERFMRDGALRERCVQRARAQVQTRWHLDRMVEQTLAVYDDCLTKPRILLWKLSALGDVILSTPSLRAIRKQFPHAHLALVIGRSAHEVVARCPYLNEVIIYDPTRKDQGWGRRLAFLSRLRAGRFDLSVDFQNSRATHLMAWLAGIPVRAGYRRKYGWLLNRGVRLPRVVLAPIAHQHYLLTKAGFSANGDALELWPSAQDDAAAERLLRQTGAAQPTVLVHPGGSGRWKTKRWDLDRWAKLCDGLSQRGLRVVVTGGPDERELGEALLQLTVSKPPVLIGQTSLMELACLIKRAQVFVGHDSSPLHLAAAVGTPAVALFGPTDPRRHVPPTFRGQVIYKEVACSPCYAAHCRTITHACMKQISVDEVLGAILAILADAETVPAPASP